MLLRNLYGLKQGNKTWFELLRDRLTDDPSIDGFGLTQSLVDPCIFYKEGLTIIVFVDDCLIFAADKNITDKFIAALQEQFMLTDEGPVHNYLGVEMTLHKNGQITLAQPYLLQRIITALGDSVKDCNVKGTPSVYKEVLHKDDSGPARKHTWKYRSIIGMLNYLTNTTRPDCLFATHQCARFCTDPKLSHERAVKRIVRYLKGTADKGIKLTPDYTKGIECYVDADFAGGYSKETANQPTSVLSRTGFVIYYLGCPVVWLSKMQTEIALSTTEVEYIALSQATRGVIPMQNLILELECHFGNITPKPTISCTLFEDNNGAIQLAQSPRYRPRTTHIAIKYHHFWSHVGKTVEIKPINTKEQIADQFTKGLSIHMFEYLRKKLMGW